MVGTKVLKCARKKELEDESLKTGLTFPYPLNNHFAGFSDQQPWLLSTSTCAL